MATHRTGIDISVYTNYAVTTDHLVGAFLTFDLEMAVIFKTNVAHSPPVLSPEAPAGYYG